MFCKNYYKMFFFCVFFFFFVLFFNLNVLDHSVLCFIKCTGACVGIACFA